MSEKALKEIQQAIHELHRRPGDRWSHEFEWNGKPYRYEFFGSEVTLTDLSVAGKRGAHVQVLSVKFFENAELTIAIHPEIINELAGGLAHLADAADTLEPGGGREIRLGEYLLARVYSNDAQRVWPGSERRTSRFREVAARQARYTKTELIRLLVNNQVNHAKRTYLSTDDYIVDEMTNFGARDFENEILAREIFESTMLWQGFQDENDPLRVGFGPWYRGLPSCGFYEFRFPDR